MGKGSYVLYESAVGYALFEVEEGEEIGALLPDVQAASFDLQKFSKMVKFKSFVPFASSESALQNINDVSEGNVNDDLKTFLDMNLSELKSKGITLGVADPKLATSIQTATGLVCRVDDTIREYVRGIRAHFPKLVKIVSGGVTDRAQLGLGHSYSRCKVKFNVNRSDNMIIQAIALLDQLDKDLNTFAMRVKEWYSWHFPEMSVLVKDNYLYSRVAQVIQSRTKFLKDEAEGRKKLTEILMDDDVVDKVVAAMRTSMGMDVSEIDMLNIKTFAARVVSLSKYRKGLQDYLTERMTAVAPNLQALIGDVVGARLISHAGSLTNLAKAPASTVQILGAEKALFRALKTRGNTPKYGLIYHSTFIGRAGTKNKGRISRYLANKCSIASRIDAFSDQATAKYGEMLRDQVEERLKFYDTGETPRKNMDCMSAVARELSADADSTSTPSSKKRKATAWDGDDDSDAAPSSKKKKSKKEKKEKKEKKKKKKSM